MTRNVQIFFFVKIEILTSLTTTRMFDCLVITLMLIEGKNSTLKTKLVYWFQGNNAIYTLEHVYVPTETMINIQINVWIFQTIISYINSSINSNMYNSSDEKCLNIRSLIIALLTSIDTTVKEIFSKTI